MSKWVPMWNVPLFRKDSTGAAETMIGLAPVVAPTREEAREIARSCYEGEMVMVGTPYRKGREVLVGSERKEESMPNPDSVLTMIQNECEEDARSLDGQPSNGRVVAQRLGEIYAMISALARIMQEDRRGD